MEMDSPSKSISLGNLTMQMEEIRILEAMFPAKKEIVWHDPSLLIDMEKYIESSGGTSYCLRFLSFTLNLDILLTDDTSKLRILVSIILPTLYPDVYPIISMTSNEITRKNQSKINHDLTEYMSTLDHGDVILLNLITWIQDNVLFYVDKDAISQSHDTDQPCKTESKAEQISMWLYMHHIYNKEKRKNIINWAEELSLSGFSLPGKPGVVYIEGDGRNVEEYYDRLRRLTWKRMSCKVKEICKTRIFDSFQELNFDVHGGRDYHMDLGKFYLFLKENGLDHMFKELFGVEGHG